MTSARKALAIAAINVRRLSKDRTGLFFVVIFPFLLIFVLGATFGSGFTPRVGVAAAQAPLADEIVQRLRSVEGIEVQTFASADAMREAVLLGDLEGGFVIPRSYDADLRDGRPVEVPWVTLPTGAGGDLSLIVASVIDQQSSLVNAARLAQERGAADSFDEALARARAASETVPIVEVRTSTAGNAEGSGLSTAAAQELTLFVFVTSLSAASMLVESRRLGVSRRMIASPTSIATVLTGEALGRFAIALLQGLLIVLGSTVLFGIDWGNLGTVVLSIALLSLAATGAAMLFGALMRSEQQAGAVGVFVGLALAALGGSMVPLEVFPPVMERIAHLTPHAWALGAMDDAITRGATPAEAWRDLTVLAIYGVVLFAAAVPLFRRSLTSTPAAA
ncbi:MAG TPA: ABC transporter permease [Actinomycetota bacterium]|nr:ABC transporter permease [Actinomycetota bacterium]